MFFPLNWQHTDTHTHTHTHTIPVRGGVLHESQKLTTRPLRSLAVKALRGMPPTLFNSAASRPRCKSASRHVAGPPVLFTNRSITRCLGHVGDRQIFNFTVSGAPGSTYPGRRHAAEALNGEAAKRPSLSADPRRRAQQNLSLERSERGPPSGPGPRVCPKTTKSPAMCVSALKKGLKRPPCKSVCECVCVCVVSHVFLGPKRKMLKSVCVCVCVLVINTSFCVRKLGYTPKR